MKKLKATTADQKAKQRLVTTVFVAAIFVVIVLVIVLVAIIESYKTVTVDILVAPQDAVVTLNGDKYSNGKHRLEPGEYEISITHSELEPYHKTVEFADGEEVKIYLYLTGPDGDMSWYLTHPNDDMTVTTIGDYYANEKSQQYVASDPVFAVTPYYDYNNGFRINAARNDDGKVEIIVYLYTCDDGKVEGLKANARSWLEQQGLELDKYTMTYKYCDV